MTDRSIPMMNENGVAQILTDVGFLEDTFAAMGHEHLNGSFTEIRSVRLICACHIRAIMLMSPCRPRPLLSPTKSLSSSCPLCDKHSTATSSPSAFRRCWKSCLSTARLSATLYSVNVRIRGEGKPSRLGGCSLAKAGSEDGL